MFGGRSLPVLSHLIDSGNLTLEDVKEAEEILRKAAITKKPSECDGPLRSPVAIDAVRRHPRRFLRGFVGARVRTCDMASGWRRR